jgi:hypothetical protein
MFQFEFPTLLTFLTIDFSERKWEKAQFLFTENFPIMATYLPLNLGPSVQPAGSICITALDPEIWHKAG